MAEQQNRLCGVDEAGRGPLAGAVFAAAVILDPTRPISGLADSKKLSAARREQLFEVIQAQALCWCIAQASVEEIDRLNILQATLLAMRRAVDGLRFGGGVPPRVVEDDGVGAREVQAHAPGLEADQQAGRAGFVLCLELLGEPGDLGPGQRRGLGGKAAAAVLLAKRHGCEGVVVVVDRDAKDDDRIGQLRTADGIAQGQGVRIASGVAVE